MRLISLSHTHKTATHYVYVNTDFTFQPVVQYVIVKLALQNTIAVYKQPSTDL